MSKIERVDNKEIAYCIGFLIGDSSITKSQYIVLTIQLRDKAVVEFIQKHLNGDIRESHILNKVKRIFPNVKLSIKKINNNLANPLKYYGGYLKSDRHFPRIDKKLDKYLLLGFFDAEGTFTFGFRKDRKRIWQKVGFTSQLKMLEGVQNLLIKIDINSKIYPVKNSKHFRLEFSNCADVYKFYKYVYDDLVVLDRKFKNFEKWLKVIENDIFINIGDTVSCFNIKTVKKFFNISMPNKLNGLKNCKVISIKNKKLELEKFPGEFFDYKFFKKTDEYLPLRIELEELLESHYKNEQSAAEPKVISEGSETTGVPE